MTVTYTVSQLVDDTLTHLEGTAHDEVNLLKVALDVSTTDAVDAVTLTYDLGGCVPGAYLSIDDEAMLVLAISDQTQTATVLRGQKGSTAAAHNANAKVLVDPAWPRWVVMQTLRDEIRSWGPQVFRMSQVDITLADGILGYDLGITGPVFRILQARMTAPPYIGDTYSGFGGVTPVTPSKEWPEVGWEFLNGNAPTSDFPSGFAVIFRSMQIVVPGTLHLTLALPFDVDTAWADDTDLLANVGLDSTHLDIPPIGAAWRLLAYRQPRRLFTQMQGQPRDANEVPALALMQAADEFKRLRDSRLLDAQATLLTKFPLEINFA